MNAPEIKVYVKTNAAGCITDVNSSIFLQDATGWTQIDEGIGDRYAHAQGNYFEKPLIDENGCFIYKLVDGHPVERTGEEKATEIAARPSPPPTEIDQIRADVDYIAVMMGVTL
ncbi:hypothetical protein [Caproiciproducens sp. LBM24188]